MKTKKTALLKAFLLLMVWGIFSAAPGVCGLIYEEGYDTITNPDLPHREGVKVGNVVLHSALKIGTDFETNIFLADTGEKYDTITRVAPSIGVEVPMEENRFSAEYEAAMSFFQHFGEQDHVDHKARTLLGINLTDFKIILDDNYRLFTNRAGSSETGTTGRRTREERNDVRLSAGAEFEHLSYQVAYKNGFRRFAGKNQTLFSTMNYDDKNSVYNLGNIEVDYSFTPKTALVVETSAGRIQYHSDLVPDSYLLELLFGVKSHWIEKLKVDFRLGGRYQNYEASSLMFDGDFFGVVGKGEITYSLTPDDAFGLTLERTIRESLYQNLNYYNTNLIGLDYTHKFTDKIEGNLFFSWQLNRYPAATTESGTTARRKDNTYRTGANVTYDVQKWLALKTGYEYRGRNSVKFPSLDYVDHVASVQATVGF